MNTVRRCLFIVLFAVLVRPAFAAPGAASLIAPSGDVVGTTLAFSWQAVPESTWYLFWLGKGTPTAFVMEQWYTAEQAGCATGGICTITLTPPMNAGSHVWFIRTWGAGVEGPWSAGKPFVVKDPATNWSSRLPDERRFTLVLNDEGVLDNETGLVWQRAPYLPSAAWIYAIVGCASEALGGRRGWRAPTLSELLSFVDPSRNTPSLPAGHPFISPTGFNNYFWTQTPAPNVANNSYAVEFTGGAFTNAGNEFNYRRWCVRSGGAGIY